MQLSSTGHPVRSISARIVLLEERRVCILAWYVRYTAVVEANVCTDDGGRCQITQSQKGMHEFHNWKFHNPTTSMVHASTLAPFPFARHTSLLGVQTILLGFVALYLPRSTFLLTEVPGQVSSRDRPQHPFLKPITADPLLTLGWLCLGAAVVQVWWAGKTRALWRERNVTPETGGDEQRVKSSLTEGKQRWKVCSFPTFPFLTHANPMKGYQRCYYLDARSLHCLSLHHCFVRGTNN